MMYRFLKHSSRFVTVLGQNAVKDLKSKAATTAGLSYKIRPIKEEDIPGVIKITKENSFQYPASSLRSWMTHDPEGLLVAVNDAGRVLGLCGCLKYTDNLCFGGMFCVAKEFRNLEIGYKIFDRCFEKAKSENIGCNCTSDMINAYKRRGFGVLESDWSLLEHETYNVVNPEVLVDNLPEGVDIKPYHDTLFPDIVAYDHTLSDLDRTRILDLSFHEDDSLHLVALKGRTCVGFGSIKLNIQGAGQVGPLYADDPCIAEAMLKRLVMGMTQAKGWVMVTISSNPHANEHLKKLGLTMEHNTLRMYRNARVPFATSKIYAIFDVDFSVF